MKFPWVFIVNVLFQKLRHFGYCTNSKVLVISFWQKNSVFQSHCNKMYELNEIYKKINTLYIRKNYRKIAYFLFSYLLNLYDQSFFSIKESVKRLQWCVMDEVGKCAAKVS